ncbi:NAD(P)-dependent oxidoreductase [Sulfuriroseicoccus oceanibius]|uniref:D-2-hydroxyacid dehydrogenase n=1 Tax=Sulfuriroseicoccus oceanibius TaxID=2707525 RepID=A0A6B3L4Y4_9BACT|nr:NAD(P)-dependent oxidoreductase [Sulfuriroseicoccus oceanibius]QQL44443.1 D-2-hydroxyacid dehydrogenase [Sulfuriroseicoccus oceanibius]
MKPRLAFFHSQITESPALSDDLAHLESLCDVTYHPFLVGSPEKLAEHAAAAEIIIANDVALTASDLPSFPKLQLVSLLGSGYDMISLADTRDRGITVCNEPSYGATNVAQHALALILELCHRVGDQNQALKADGWRTPRRQIIADHPILELDGLTLGLIGFGRIAKKLATVAAALGMRVIAASSQSEQTLAEFGVGKVTQDELFATSDFISLHCRASESTRGLVNARLLGLMKPTAFLINTARGELIDDPALFAALDNGTIAGAAIDVLAQEPPADDHPLVAHPRCIVTPHIAWNSQPARERLVKATIHNIEAFLNGSPVNQVN